MGGEQDKIRAVATRGGEFGRVIGDGKSGKREITRIDHCRFARGGKIRSSTGMSNVRSVEECQRIDKAGFLKVEDMVVGEADEADIACCKDIDRFGDGSEMKEFRRP